MTIAKGVSLGPYEIVAHIGAGGMGDVWRARDSRIGRDVAVKILPESWGEGDERVRRFEQEARAAGALNHPGLVTIFDVGTTSGSPYIVMELLEGQTLRDAIGKGDPQPLPLRKAIDYGQQIASALAVAHEKGIIHRDLKPENLFITADDRVKILDFGLAKLAADAPESDVTHTQRHLTSAGIVVGTPGYMSPEQARAQSLDHRTDIFSLGTVLYEMVTGKCPFENQSAVETMHAVLALEPPPLARFAANVPAALEAIVRHCMEKQPRDRFQSARDLAFQLRTLMPDMQSTLTGRRQSRAIALPRVSRRAVLTTIAALAIGGSAGFAIYRVSTAGVPETATRAFHQLTYADGLEAFPTLAPDGKSFAFVSSQSGNRDIYVQRVDGRIPIDITSDSPDDDSEPAFSPDGSQIAFRSERSGGGIFVMGVTGESVRRLTDAGHNPAWSPDGTRFVYSTQAVALRPHIRPDIGTLWIVDTRTEQKKLLVQAHVGGPDFGRESDAVQPNWSPHGKRIAFWGVSNTRGFIYTIDPDAPQPKETVVQVTSAEALEWNPVWSPDGQYLYFGSDRDGTLNLWRIAMDEESGKPAGQAERVALPAVMAGNFTFSAQGDLAFALVTRTDRLVAFPFDPATAATGVPHPLFGGSQEILTFDVSPDGTQVAFTTGGTQEDVFIANADGSRLRQFTNDAARDRGVTWSPDGKTLYFYSNRDGAAYHIWSIRADGGGLARVTDPADLKRVGGQNIYVPEVSPDGRTLAVQINRDGAFVHLDRPMGQRLERFHTDLGALKWSPDGKRLVADVGGAPSVAVYSLESRRLEKVLNRGDRPRWIDDKRIAFFDDKSINVLDLETRTVTSSPFAPVPEIWLDAVTPRFSRDGKVLYARQTIEQGDIWMMRVQKP